MEVYITEAISLKLKEKHNVTEAEVLQCFRNRLGPDMLDLRAEHRTDPPTRWFISSTNRGRRLKIVYVRHSADEAVVKTAYEPNITEIRIYKTMGERK